MLDLVAAAAAGGSIILILWGAALCLYEACASLRRKKQLHGEHLEAVAAPQRLTTRAPRPTF